MYRPRIIPFLLLKNLGLVKSVKFKNHRYIGDPINAVKIFNDLKADELAFVDIEATVKNTLISLDFVKSVGEEANMPFSVGGGIKSIEDIRKILEAGAEKAIINSYAAINPEFIKQAVDEFGSSTIAVCIDVKRNLFGKNYTWINSGKKSTGRDPLKFAKEMEELGAGEIVLQSIANDGTMWGYDIPLIKEVSEQLSIPITVIGGAGSYDHMKEVLKETTVNGLGAGSLFVYHGERKAVLINYPNYEEIIKIVKGENAV